MTMEISSKQNLSRSKKRKSYPKKPSKVTLEPTDPETQKAQWRDFQFGSSNQPSYQFANNKAQQLAVFGTEDQGYFFPDLTARQAFPNGGYRVFMKSVTPDGVFWRIIKRAKREGDCLVWRGNQQRGHGRIQVNGRLQYVHRLMYEIIKGKTTGNIKHTCNNSLCCRPEHLEPYRA